MNGLDLRLLSNINNDISIENKIKYIKGETQYDGKTWGGTPVSFKENGVYILNSDFILNYNLAQFDNLYIKTNLGLGNYTYFRGKGEYVGAYEELYKWYYGSVGINLDYDINKDFSIALETKYKKSFDGKLRTGLGVNFDLKDITGYTVAIPLEYKINNNISLITEYSYEFWDMPKTDNKPLKIGNTTYQIYKPDREMNNQMLSLRRKFLF